MQALETEAVQVLGSYSVGGLFIVGTEVIQLVNNIGFKEKNVPESSVNIEECSLDNSHQ